MGDAIEVALERRGAAEDEIHGVRLADRPAAGFGAELEQGAGGPERLVGMGVHDTDVGLAELGVEAERL